MHVRRLVTGGKAVQSDFRVGDRVTGPRGIGTVVNTAHFRNAPQVHYDAGGYVYELATSLLLMTDADVSEYRAGRECGVIDAGYRVRPTITVCNPAHSVAWLAGYNSANPA
jgi:hypothetical protein